MINKAIYDNFQSEKKDIDNLVKSGLIDIQFMEKFLIRKYFEVYTRSMEKLDAYSKLADQFCKSESTIMRIVNKPIVVYW